MINHSLPPLFVGYISFIPKISFVVEFEDGEDEEKRDISEPLILIGLGTCRRPVLFPDWLLASASLLRLRSGMIVAGDLTAAAWKIRNTISAQQESQGLLFTVECVIFVSHK